MIASAQHCSGGGLSYDDVDLFGRLRSLTIVRGLTLPDTVSATQSRGGQHRACALCCIAPCKAVGARCGKACAVLSAWGAASGCRIRCVCA